MENSTQLSNPGRKDNILDKAIIFMYNDVLLQGALDFEKLSDAKRVAKLLSEELSGVKWYCEAGTPLIKNEGMIHVIPELRDIVGDDVTIVADLKTLDTGAFEVDLAYKAGADIVGIAGIAGEKTINAALEKGKELKIPIMIDSIRTEDMYNQLDWIINRITDYNADGGKAILEYHISIDEQTQTMDFTKVRDIYRKSPIPIAAAGGLNEITIPEVLGYGAKVCVVGGTITKQPDEGSMRNKIGKIKEIIYGGRDASVIKRPSFYGSGGSKALV